MPDKILSAVREELAGKLGISLTEPEKNDPALVSDFNTLMENVRKNLVAKTGSENTPIKTDNGEMEMLADVIRASAEELKNARAGGGPGGTAAMDPNARAKTQPEMQDDIKAGFALWAEEQRRGVRFSNLELPVRNFSDMITRPTTNDDLRRFQQTNDQLLMTAAMLGYRRTAAGAVVANVAPLKRWAEMQEPLRNYMSRAMDTTEASDWVPTEMSADMVEKIYEQTQLMQLFPRIDFPMGIGTLDIPTEGADVNVYLAGEATADDGDAKYVAGTPGVGKVSISPKVLASRIVTSEEMIEDSAIAIAPYMSMKMVRAFARDIDDIIINGDTTATHHDTGYTVAANDRRRAWTGLIEKALTDTGANSDCGTYFNFESFIKPTILMGAYADDASRVVCIMNRSTAMQLGYLADTNGNPVFLTAQQWGQANAPASQGAQAIGQVYGYRVVTSAKVGRNLNASGIYDGSTTTKSVAIWAHLDSLLMAVKRDMRLVGVDRPEQGQRVLVGTWRGAMAHVPSTSTDLSVAMSYGIPNGA